MIEMIEPQCIGDISFGGGIWAEVFRNNSYWGVKTCSQVY